MSYTLTQQSAIYQKAVKAVEALEEPALGFVRPSDYKGGLAAPSAAIKQNNTLIQLIVDLTQKVDDLSIAVQQQREEIRKFVESQKKRAVDAAETSGHQLDVDELINKLDSLKLGEPGKVAPKEKKGELKVFKDPKAILAFEKEKIRK